MDPKERWLRLVSESEDAFKMYLHAFRVQEAIWSAFQEAKRSGVGGMHQRVTVWLFEAWCLTRGLEDRWREAYMTLHREAHLAYEAAVGTMRPMHTA